LSSADEVLGHPHRLVAVKVVPATSDEIYRIYFERETAAHHKLDHPNIVSLLDSGTDHDAGVYLRRSQLGTGVTGPRHAGEGVTTVVTIMRWTGASRPASYARPPCA
jgi:serine/threonine protein kinase